MAILTPAQVWLPTIHHAVGALILGLSFVLAVKAWRYLQPATATTGIAPAEPGATLRQAAAYLELTKPRIVSMVLVTTTLGWFLGAHGLTAWPRLLLTLLGVGAATGGAAALNNYLEREVDGLMVRTRNRPLPAGVIAPAPALAWGVSLVLGGVILLAAAVNVLTGFLVLLAAFLYVIVYTPMKRITWWNTSIGAIPGAIPPLCGWAAATGRLDPGAWVLFAILFAWQHPHFFAIAWMFRDDYRTAGFRMLPVVEPRGGRTFALTLGFCVALLLVSVVPSAIGMAGRLYGGGAVVLGLGLLLTGWMMTRSGSFLDARRLLKASVIYLPLLLALIILDAGF
jgi:protoheme IX farnesyltransferase